MVILGYFLGLAQLTRVATGRQAFYFGLGVGLLTAAPQLFCFWTIFGVSAVALWFVVAVWVGLFVCLARECRQRVGTLMGTMLMPLLWTGLEYFRSELYYLRFSWLNGGYAFADNVAVLSLFPWLGVYGTGFLLMAAAAFLSRFGLKQGGMWALRLGLFLIVILFLLAYFKPMEASEGKALKIAGVQLEFPTVPQVKRALDELIRKVPDAEVLMLSEYTFDGPVPEVIREWCREHQRFLIAGGKEPGPRANFYDTAYVVGRSGEIVFQQGKSVPIQFFNDGLPASEQRVWNSPWGKIGMCVCYDLSYTEVTDRLVRLGAEAILVPTMDLVSWGRREHELHARVAPVRSAEYRLPIFRVACSGISQWTDRSGRVRAQAVFPGENEPISGVLHLKGRGSVPLDRWLAPVCTGVTALLLVMLSVWAAVAKWRGPARKEGVRA